MAGKVIRGSSKRAKAAKTDRPGAGRKALTHRKSAMKAARAQVTKTLKGGEVATGSFDDGVKLKNGLRGMAQRASMDAETKAKIEAMDEQNLAGMFEQNDRIFEVTFSYGGIELDDEIGAYVVDDRKKREVKVFVEEYERLYGPIAPAS